VENTASLKLLLAMEAETKRRAAIVKKHYVGPSVKFHSVKVNDGERVRGSVPGLQLAPLHVSLLSCGPTSLSG